MRRPITSRASGLLETYATASPASGTCGSASMRLPAPRVPGRPSVVWGELKASETALLDLTRFGGHVGAGLRGLLF